MSIEVNYTGELILSGQGKAVLYHIQFTTLFLRIIYLSKYSFFELIPLHNCILKPLRGLINIKSKFYFGGNLWYEKQN